MRPIDLHTHTTASDGTYTPEQLIQYGIRKGLAAIAITDHDTLAGVIEAKNSPRREEIEVISGIEFSTNLSGVTSDLHILGLYIDEKNETFTTKLSDILNERNRRNQKMIEKLNQVGISITYQDVIDCSADGVITRAHFGKALLKKGVVQSLESAFQKYIGNDCIAYVPRQKFSPLDAIEMINECGGLAFLAHPFLYHLDLRQLETLIKTLNDHGLAGIEGIYSLHNKQETRILKELAEKYKLLISGGSDFHGGNKASIDLGVGYGDLVVPYELLSGIKETRWKKYGLS